MKQKKAFPITEKLMLF